MSAELLQVLVKLGIFLAPLMFVPICVMGERRLSAWMQKRVGPNRVGPFGILQPMADAVKLILKEDVIPEKVDRLLFVAAPLIGLVPVLISVALIPLAHPFEFGGQMIELQGANLNAGILFVFSILSLEVYGIAMAGWSSNNKFSLLGGLRSGAQMISYEIAMGLAVVAVLMTAGDLNLQNIIFDQTGSGTEGSWHLFDWNIFRQPIAFLLFLIAMFAENNRLPFDMPECEPELVGGYHTEYSSMKFSLFFMTEYVAMMVMSCVITVLFLGGWHIPFTDPADPFWSTLIGSMLTLGCFVSKVGFFMFFYIWVRWSMPRFRYDQLMDLGWKVFIPVAVVNIMVTALLTVNY